MGMNCSLGEAEPKDAAELVAFLNRVSLETDFTSLDGDGILS